MFDSCRNETHEVIKYLEFCVKDLNNEDPGVHNLLLSLYAKKVILLAQCIFFMLYANSWIFLSF
jgi:hypothetical protein